jgi:hypothetical protein
MVLTVPSTGGFSRKQYSSPVLKICVKNPRNKKNEGRKPDKKSSLKRIKFMPRNVD